MSIRLITEVWRVDLPTSEKFVLVAMADEANDEGFCYPGQERIATKTALSVRQVRTIQHHLTEIGYLQRLSRGGKFGDTGRSARWMVTVPPSQPATTSGAESPTGNLTRPNRKSDASQPATTSGYPSESREGPVDPNRKSLPVGNPKPVDESWAAYLKRMALGGLE